MIEKRRSCCEQENVSIAARWTVSSLAGGHFYHSRCEGKSGEDSTGNGLLVGVSRHVSGRGTLVLPLLQPSGLPARDLLRPLL